MTQLNLDNTAPSPRAEQLRAALQHRFDLVQGIVRLPAEAWIAIGLLIESAHSLGQYERNQQTDADLRSTLDAIDRRLGDS